MGQRRKADCTPEQWEAILATNRNQQMKPADIERRKDRARKRYVKVVRPAQLEALAVDPHFYRAKKRGVPSAALVCLLAAQGNKCAICKKALIPGRENLDHDHVTGKPRGFLCTPCNTAEGWVKRWGAALAAYLKDPPAKDILDIA